MWCPCVLLIFNVIIGRAHQDVFITGSFTEHWDVQNDVEMRCVPVTCLPLHLSNIARQYNLVESNIFTDILTYTDIQCDPAPV